MLFNIIHKLSITYNEPLPLGTFNLEFLLCLDLHV